jgi:GNAT superfamily N-acetyltransferase
MIVMKITSATVADIPEIIAFIHKLAEYEKLAHEVVVTPELLQSQLFDRKGGEVLFLEVEGVRVAFALFFHNFSTFLGRRGIYLEDLFVLPEHRGRGYGKRMLTYLARLTVERDCGRLDWAVLDWNQPAIDFYEKLGAVPLPDWTTFRMTGDALKNLAKQYDGGSV